MKKLLMALVLLGFGLVGQSCYASSALNRGYKAVTSQEKLAQALSDIQLKTNSVTKIPALNRSIESLKGHATNTEMQKCPGLKDARNVLSGLSSMLHELNMYGVFSKDVSVKIDTTVKQLNDLITRFNVGDSQAFTPAPSQSSSANKDKLQQMETKSGQLKQEAKTLNQNATALKEQQKKEAEKSWTQTAKEMFGLGKKDK